MEERNQPLPPPPGAGQLPPPPPMYPVTADIPPQSPYHYSPAPKSRRNGAIAGTLGATAALVLFGSTHWVGFLIWAYYGFLINLFNLIPFGMLDGGWILAPVSKWVQVAGLAVLVGLFIAQLVSPLVIILFIIGIPMVIQRFRDRAVDAHLTSGPAAARSAMGAAWLALVVYLACAMSQHYTMLNGSA